MPHTHLIHLPLTLYAVVKKLSLYEMYFYPFTIASRRVEFHSEVMYGKLIKLNASHMPNFMSNFWKPTGSANICTFSRSFFLSFIFKLIE